MVRYMNRLDRKFFNLRGKLIYILAVLEQEKGYLSHDASKY